MQEGAKYLERPMEAGASCSGAFRGGARKVMILGGGVVGSRAAKIAAGLGADVMVFDTSLNRLRYLDDVMPSNVSTLMSNAVNVRTHLRDADLVIGAVLRVGARTPMLVTRGDLKLMKPRSVVVDVAVDQGGCFETTRPTTHSNPVYVEENVVHYWSQISPGLWQGPQHSPSQRHCALRIDLAEKGWRRALKKVNHC